jgi:hypothetical protein
MVLFLHQDSADGPACPPQQSGVAHRSVAQLGMFAFKMPALTSAGVGQVDFHFGDSDPFASMVLPSRRQTSIQLPAHRRSSQSGYFNRAAFRQAKSQRRSITILPQYVTSSPWWVFNVVAARSF